jgi:hypothetical protein
MSKFASRSNNASSGLYGGNQHARSLASDWTFCEYYVPAPPVSQPEPRKNIWGRIVSR